MPVSIPSIGRYQRTANGSTTITESLKFKAQSKFNFLYPTYWWSWWKREISSCITCGSYTNKSHNKEASQHM